ncbi:MAG: 3-hydroxyacyl-CoA dehydrogenase/enoyl-CoA hydratase family protein [Deltaproteobacteria bacterium]|nr:3-hydroxyacyl-CoA dehydrogenase/enoyl-CoA hydratase family protein [Deltaproteobacteria bacterium]
MARPIRRVAVLGAGVMGSGIAAHLASASIPVLLLDIVPPTLTEAEKSDPAARNRFAASGLEKATKNRPALFMHPSRASLVTVGNFDDDLQKLSECDLVIEAIVERLDIKRSLFEKLDNIVGDETIVASNTSGLRIKDMLEGRSQRFREHFLVMHFFNPVRYMKLLELVVGPDTQSAVFNRVKSFGENSLGKGIVLGKDTTNFVGNRIGAFSMMAAIHQMIADQLTPEDVDAIAGSPLGRPKSAAFGTADLVGLDTFAHVAKNCFDGLPDDESRDVFALPAYITGMIEKKLLGNKTKSGFYRKASDGSRETYDPYTHEYRAQTKNPAIQSVVKGLRDLEDSGERVRALLKDEGPAGQFAWKTLAQTLVYTAKRIPEIADTLWAVDDAMRWGYNWDLGPFETWDAIGLEASCKRMKAEGRELPAWIDTMLAKGAKTFYAADGRVWDPTKSEYVVRATDVRTRAYSSVRTTVLEENEGATLWDTGDGVFALTHKTKSNSIDQHVITMIHKAVDRAERDGRALLLFNEGDNFCVGANLFAVVAAAMQGEWEGIRLMASELQKGALRMKNARVPVVAAPYGFTFGGGLELCLGANNVQAAAETYAGLVEVGVGLVPAGGGTAGLLWRAMEGIPEGAAVDSYAIVTQVFKNIALAKVATSAAEAQELGYFRKNDGVSFDRARHFYEAKQRAIGLAESGWIPPAPKAYKLPGASGIATLDMMVRTLVDGGQASAHDALIAGKVANILCGGKGGHVEPVTEEKLHELEVEAFVSLCGEPKSQERMQFMLMNNKPLRN